MTRHQPGHVVSISPRGACALSSHNAGVIREALAVVIRACHPRRSLLAWTRSSTQVRPHRVASPRPRPGMFAQSDRPTPPQTETRPCSARTRLRVPRAPADVVRRARRAPRAHHRRHHQHAAQSRALGFFREGKRKRHERTFAVRTRTRRAPRLRAGHRSVPRPRYGERGVGGAQRVRVRRAVPGRVHIRTARGGSRGRSARRAGGDGGRERVVRRAAALRRFHACDTRARVRGSPTREHLPKTIAPGHARSCTRRRRAAAATRVRVRGGLDEWRATAALEAATAAPAAARRRCCCTTTRSPGTSCSPRGIDQVAGAGTSRRP